MRLTRILKQLNFFTMLFLLNIIGRFSNLVIYIALSFYYKPPFILCPSNCNGVTVRQPIRNDRLKNPWSSENQLVFYLLVIVVVRLFFSCQQGLFYLMVVIHVIFKVVTNKWLTYVYNSRILPNVYQLLDVHNSKSFGKWFRKVSGFLSPSILYDVKLLSESGTSRDFRQRDHRGGSMKTASRALNIISGTPIPRRVS